MNNKILSYIIFAIIFFLVIIIYKKRYNNKRENFTSLLKVFSDIAGSDDKKNNIKLTSPIVEPVVEKKRIKYIYLAKIEKTNNSYKYNFYNKKYNKYISIIGNNIHYQKDIIIKDLHNNIIGTLINEIYNKLIFNISLYKNNVNIEYLDNYAIVKIYLDDDDKSFKIKKDNNFYIIYLYEKNIGKISFKNNIYKIMVYEEYKTYLNILGLGMILLLNN